MTISVFNIINSNYAVNQEDGEKLFEAIKSIPTSELTVSLENIEHLSTLFLNESIGKLAIIKSSEIQAVKFVYPNDKVLFASKVNNIIENALMGDEYDALVDAAKVSL